MTGAAHPDSGALADLATGVPVSADVRRHVDSCSECRADLAVLRSLLESEPPESAVERASADVPADQPAAMADTPEHARGQVPPADREGPGEHAGLPAAKPLPTPVSRGRTAIGAASMVLILAAVIWVAWTLLR